MKTIALYGLQMLVGLVALAAGYAKLTGMDFMAAPFAMIGLGNTFLLIAGTVEIAAGLCLLYPRSGVVGAVLLTTVMIGTMGASLGTVISHRGDAQQVTASQTFRTAVGQGSGMVKSVIIKKSQGWDI
jgi:uncharacterized membrane protein YphA (DoxX/SURF4 family)